MHHYLWRQEKSHLIPAIISSETTKFIDTMPSRRKRSKRIQGRIKLATININIDFTMPPGANTPYLDQRFSISSPATPTSDAKRPRMPSMSPVISDTDASAARDRYFNILYNKYTADNEKSVNAEEKLDAEDLDLKTIRKFDDSA